MGLDTTHDCWHGAYSSFASFRRVLAALVGLDLAQMEGFGGSQKFPSKEDEPAVILLNHSDCDGEIAAEDCEPLAYRLEQLMKVLPDEDIRTACAKAGYYSAPEYYRERVQNWIDGLREAHAAGEAVEFH